MQCEKIISLKIRERPPNSTNSKYNMEIKMSETKIEIKAYDAKTTRRKETWI